MKVTLLSYTHSGDYLAGYAAAVCTRSDKPDKARDHALKAGHESIAEHVVFTFEVEDVSRVTLAQLTRHRLASYEVESQRYTDNGKRPVAVPPSIAAHGELDAKFLRLVQMSREFYEEATAAGVPREDARFAALEGTCTRLVMTMNARELRHFFALRCCNRAQWEIRHMADMMLDICKDKCPALFADAGPGCVRGRCPEVKPCGTPRAHDWEDD